MMAEHSDMHRKMRKRNFAMLGILVTLVIVVLVSTYIKLGGGF